MAKATKVLTRPAVLFSVLVVAGFALRLAYILSVRHRWVGGDGFGYSISSQRLAEGHGFRQPIGPPVQDASHPPLWTMVLALPHLLGRHSWLALQVFASLIGTATVAVVGLATHRIAGTRAAIAATAIAAIYPGFWMFERELLSETLLILGVAVAVLVFYSFIPHLTLARAIALGVLTGALALVRSEQVILLFVLVVPAVLLAKGPSRRARVGYLAAAFAAAAVVISPWAIYNSTRFDHPVPLSDNLGVAMTQGNCDRVLSGPRFGYYDARCFADARTRVDLVGADQSTADIRLRRDAYHFIGAHLADLPRLVGARLGRVWGLYRPFQTARFEAQWSKSPVWVHDAALIMYWPLLAVAAVGFAILRRRSIPVYPLVAVAITVVAATALTAGEPRYRAAADVPIVVLAGVAVDAMLRRRMRPPAARIGVGAEETIDQGRRRQPERAVQTTRIST